ncbi:hypothetical protein D3C85_1323350 [compost metagenome]
MHSLDTHAAQLQFDVEGKIRCIDTDEDIRLALDQGLHQQLATLEQLTQAPQHFDQAHHRQALHGEIGGQSLGLHERTTDADELDVRVTLLEGAHQACAKNVAAGLSGDQRYA